MLVIALTVCFLAVYFLVRASTTTSRGPVTGPRTSNVLTVLKNWKQNLEKLESHLNICNIDLNHWNRVMKNSLLNQPSMFSFFYFLFTDEPLLVVRPMSDLLLFSKKSKKAYSPSSEGWMSYYL